MPRIAYKNFTGGEVAPTLTGRYDLERYATSAQCVENMLPGLHGDVTRRPGTHFVGELGGYSVLFPFSFNVDTSQNFVLLLSDKKLRVSDGISAISAPIAAPWAAADLSSISFAQVGDIVYMAHPNYPLYKIMRTGEPGAYAWQAQVVNLNQTIAAPAKPSVSFSSGSGYTLRYKVVAVDVGGMESVASEAGECNGKHPSDWVQGNYASVSWAAVPGAVEYNIYRESAGYFGFIGISKGLNFVDNNYEAKVDDTPRENWNPFADGNNPSTVTFHQQRMVLGGSRNNPQTFYMSRAGDFECFRKSRPLQEDDPVEYMLASGSIDAIQWMAGFGDLLIGTAGSEYKATGDNGVITAKSVSIQTQSYWGSARLTPLIIGNSILHVQRHGARVRDLFYSLEKDGYAGNDLSIMAPHLFEGHTLVQWAYQQTPGSHIWCVRDDGLLLALTYMKEHQIFGWSRHVTDGQVLSVAAISGNDADVVFLVVERTIAGQKHYFLERMAEPFGQDTAIADAFFVDCGISRHFETPTQIVDGLGHLEGKELSVLADGSPVEGCVVKDGKIALPWAATVVQAGLGYASYLSPLPVEADTQAGATLGKKRGLGRCVVRLYRSVGGSYGTSRERMDDFPFLPGTWNAPCEPFSGDVSCIPQGGQDAATSIWLKQDRPLPWHIIAIACDVDFGEA